MSRPPLLPIPGSKSSSELDNSFVRWTDYLILDLGINVPGRHFRVTATQTTTR